jgi:DNA-binding NarL/FixJ family response regulator
MSPITEAFCLASEGSSFAPIQADRRLAPLLEHCLVLIEPRKLFRECLIECLNGPDFRFKVCGYSDWKELEYDFNVPDEAVALMVSVSPDNGMMRQLADVVRLTGVFLPAVPVIVLADSDRPEFIQAVMGMGVRGYIPTSFSLATLREAICFVRAGGVFVPATVLQQSDQTRTSVASDDDADRLVDNLSNEACLDDLHQTSEVSLTRREAQVAALLLDGKSNKLIARELTICEGTVKVHVQRIMRKFRVENRTQAALAATHLINQRLLTNRLDATAQGNYGMGTSKRIGSETITE